MKKTLAALGIILLLASIIMLISSLSNYTVTYSDWTIDKEPLEVSNSRNITRHFFAGDLIRLEITAAKTWSDNLQPPEDDIPNPYQPIFVNITDPLGHESEMLCYFIMIDEKVPLYLYNVTVTETHGLDYIHLEVGIGGKEPSIVATALLKGNYTAYISGSFILDPPYKMKFSKGVKVSYQKYPAGYLCYPSIILLFASFPLIFFGFKEQYKRKKGAKIKTSSKLRVFSRGASTAR